MNYVLIRPIATLTMGLTYLLSQFVDFAWLPYVVSFFSLLTVAAFLHYLKKVSLILFGSMIILAVLLYLQSGNFEEMYLALSANVAVLALFIFVPLLAIPIQAGRFLDYMESVFFHLIQTTQQL